MKKLFLAVMLLAVLSVGLIPLLPHAPARPLHDELRWTESSVGPVSRG